MGRGGVMVAPVHTSGTAAAASPRPRLRAPVAAVAVGVATLLSAWAWQPPTAGVSNVDSSRPAGADGARGGAHADIAEDGGGRGSGSAILPASDAPLHSLAPPVSVASSSPAVTQAATTTMAAEASEAPSTAGDTDLADDSPTTANGTWYGGCVSRSDTPRAQRKYRIFSVVREVQLTEAAVLDIFLPALRTLCSSLPSAARAAVVDVGTNTGDDLDRWVRELGPTAGLPGACAAPQFHFFEPQRVYTELLANITGSLRQRYGASIRMHMAGVGPEKLHNQTLILEGSGQQGSIKMPGRSVAKAHQPTPPPRPRQNVTLLVLWRALALPDGSLPEVPFLKVDSEGADTTILVSSSRLFERQKVHLVVFELSRMLTKFGMPVRHVQGMFFRNGYKMMLLHGRRVRRNTRIELVEVSRQFLKNMKWMLEYGVAISPALQKVLAKPNGAFPGLSGAFSHIGGVTYGSSRTCFNTVSVPCRVCTMSRRELEDADVRRDE